MELPHSEEESELEEAVRSPQASDPMFSESAVLLVFVAIISAMGLGLFQLLAR